MRLDFNKITITNFKSFYGAHDFMLADYGRGLHFLRGRNKDETRLGSNGAGKSSLWDAMSWALYGRTPDGSRNPDIQPWHGDKQTTVSVTLRVDDKEHKITRGTHPNMLTLNEEPCGPEQIESLIGMTLPVFLNTVLLGQGQHLFYDLTPRDKMSLFSDVLNLERWEARSTHAAKTVAELETECAVWEGKLLGLTSQQAQIEGLLQSALTRADEWTRDRTKQLKVLEKEQTQVDKEVTALDKQHDKADLIYDGAVTELRAMQQEVDKFTDIIRVVSLAYDRSNQAQAFVRRQIERARTLLADLQNAAVCPTCGQPIKSKTALDKHRRELRAEIERLEKEHAATDLKKHKEALDKAQTKLNNIMDAAILIQNKANKATDDLDAIQNILAPSKARQAVLKTQITELEDGKNPHAIQARELRQQKSGLAANHRDLTADIDKRRRRIERTKFWVKGFKEIRLYVIDDVLQELELTTNAVLVDIGLINWEVKYAVQKETKSGTVQQGLHVMITSPRHKNPVRWESWSGGEGQRLRLVGALALSEVLLGNAGVEPSLEILDEPTQHLSKEGVSDLCDYLADRARYQKKQIWFVDHHVTESNRFASVVSVIKDSHGSRIGSG